MPAALAESVTVSSSESRPSSSASMTSSKVMILVTLAGSNFACGSCSYNKVPVSFSIRTQEAQERDRPAASPVAEAEGRAAVNTIAARNNETRRFIYKIPPDLDWTGIILRKEEGFYAGKLPVFFGCRQLLP